MRGWDWVGLGATLAAGLMLGAACSRSAGFACNSDEQCTEGAVQGRCEPTGFCSFPDDRCVSGWAYDDNADPELALQCVAPDGSSATSGPPPGGSEGDDGVPNGPPVAMDDAADTFMAVPVTIAVLQNDSDPDGDTLTIADTTAPASGTVAVDGDSVTYTPMDGFSGVDRFGYTIDDGRGGQALATVEVTVAGTCDTWNAAWSHRSRLTIDNRFTDPVPNEDLVDFPVLVVLDPTRLSDFRLQPTGADLRFVDADDETELAYEVDLWDPAGTSYVWVRVPRIEADSATDSIWVYHGNPNAQAGQAPTEVWPEPFRAVWHLDDDPRGPAFDSTANDNQAFWSFEAGTDAAGVIGRAYRRTAPRPLVAPTHDSFNSPDAITLEAWVNPTVVDMTIERYAINRTNSYFMHTIRSFTDSPGMWVRLGAPVSDWRNSGLNVAPLAADTWHYMAGTYETNERTLRLYLDGVLVEERSLNVAVAPIIENDEDMQLGHNIDGIIDEIRVTATQRSQTWVAAQHRSMTDAMVTYEAAAVVCP